MRVLRSSIHTRGSLLDSNLEVLDRLDALDLRDGASTSNYSSSEDDDDDDDDDDGNANTNEIENEDDIDEYGEAERQRREAPEQIIPELDMNDMIDLAQRYLNNDQVLRLQFPVQLRLNNNNGDGAGGTPTQEQVFYAREVILHNERLNNNVNEEERRRLLRRRLGLRDNGFLQGFRGRNANPGDEHVQFRFFDGQFNRIDNNGIGRMGGEGLNERMGGRGRRRGERGLLVRIFDLSVMALTPVMIYGVTKNVLSLSSFSFDIVEDTLNFIDRVQEFSTMKYAANGTSDTTLLNEQTKATLVMRFGQIILNEMPQYRDSPVLVICLSLLCFYVYTVAFSLFLLGSFSFLLLCMYVSFGRRLQSLNRFFWKLVTGGEGVM